MKILLITAYYPPCLRGWGFMRHCEQVVDGLSRRGHDVVVLTSTHVDGPEPERRYPVHRLLSIDPDWSSPRSAAFQFFVGRGARERRSVGALRALVENLEPEVVYIWHADGLSRVMLRDAENLAGVVTVYNFANYLPEHPDDYVEYWSSAQSWGAFLLKWPLALLARRILAREGKPVALTFPHSISVSRHVRQRLVDRGLIKAGTAVTIPNGVDLEAFDRSQTDRRVDPRSLRCIVAGRLSPEKGVLTVLRAMALLVQRGLLGDISLTVIGDGPRRYKEELKRFVAEHRLGSSVEFPEPVAAPQMPAVLARHSILILASEWDEPLACILLEAMAAKLLVIGTTTGGSGEVLFHEKTGLVFTPGDPQSLATQLARVAAEPALLARLSQAGWQEVHDHYRIQDAIERIERHLGDLVHGE